MDTSRDTSARIRGLTECLILAEGLSEISVDVWLDGKR